MADAQTYTVKLSDGREFDVTTEGGPPSEQDVLDSLKMQPPASAKSWWGNHPTIKAVATGAAKNVDSAAETLADFGTSPTAAGMGAKAGRAVAAVTSLPAALSGLGDPAKAAYAGGKVGWFNTKLAQDVARPVSTMLEKAAPLAEALGNVGAATNITGLAQTLEPNRTDIGMAGIGPSGQVPEGSQPPVLNALIGKYVKLLPKWAQAQFLVELGDMK